MARYRQQEHSVDQRHAGESAGIAVQHPFRRNIALGIAFAVMAGCLASCGGGADTGKSTDTADAADPVSAPNARFVRGATGSADVTYQPNVKRVEREDAIQSLVGVSSDGSTLLFDPAPVAIRNLQAGDVLLLKGILARKVLAAGTEGRLVAVLTGPVTLGEVVRDGRIRIDAPFRFSPDLVAATSEEQRPVLGRLLETAIPSAHADPVKDAYDAASKARNFAARPVKFAVDGWDVDWSLTPGAGKVDLSLTLTRDLAGVKAVVTGKGYLKDFDLSSDIEVQRGTVEKLSSAFKRVNGVMNFTWEVGKETPGGWDKEVRIKLPGAISIPLYQVLDGLPVYLEISGALILKPFITGGQQLSHGSFRITYDGTQSFQIKEGNVNSDGHVSGDIEYLADRHISALAPLAMVVSFAAPRIELTLDPLRVLSDLQQSGSLQKAMKDAAERADLWMNNLQRAIGFTQIRDDIARASGMPGDISAGKIVDSMKSNAMAYVQLVSTNATSHTGISVPRPCTRTELMMRAVVGASAQAFGQKTEPISEILFEKKVTRIDPPSAKLCHLND